jgi:hypothetical protein
MKQCDYCLKEIDAQARRCSHCGSWLGKIGKIDMMIKWLAVCSLMIFVLALGGCGLQYLGRLLK